MKKLANLLKQRQNLSPMWKSVSASLIVQEANRFLFELFGQVDKPHAKAVYFKNATVTLACLSSVVAQEIKLNEKKLMAKINQKFGENTVEKVRYLA